MELTSPNRQNHQWDLCNNNIVPTHNNQGIPHFRDDYSLAFSDAWVMEKTAQKLAPFAVSECVCVMCQNLLIRVLFRLFTLARRFGLIGRFAARLGQGVKSPALLFGQDCAQPGLQIPLHFHQFLFLLRG